MFAHAAHDGMFVGHIALVSCLGLLSGIFANCAGLSSRQCQGCIGPEGEEYMEKFRLTLSAEIGPDNPAMLYKNKVSCISGFRTISPIQWADTVFPNIVNFDYL